MDEHSAKQLTIASGAAFAAALLLATAGALVARALRVEEKEAASMWASVWKILS